MKPLQKRTCVSCYTVSLKVSLCSGAVCPCLNKANGYLGWYLKWSWYWVTEHDSSTCDKSSMRRLQSAHKKTIEEDKEAEDEKQLWAKLLLKEIRMDAAVLLEPEAVVTLSQRPLRWKKSNWSTCYVTDRRLIPSPSQMCSLPNLYKK